MSKTLWESAALSQSHSASTSHALASGQFGVAERAMEVWGFHTLFQTDA